MKVYEVVCVSHIGMVDCSYGLFFKEEDALQKAMELDIIYMEDPCRDDFSFKIKEREIL